MELVSGGELAFGLTRKSYHDYSTRYGVRILRHMGKSHNIARSEYHTQLAKMNFDKIFDFTAGVYFHFLSYMLTAGVYSIFYNTRGVPGTIVSGISAQ